jgi:metal-responsive CopG/Arc/MetJ family transcriptional regulator
MPKRLSGKRTQITITLPAYLLDNIDELAKETELNRSDIMEMLLDYCFDHSEIIDEVFPYEEEDGEDKEDGED